MIFFNILYKGEEETDFGSKESVKECAKHAILFVCFKFLTIVII